VAGRRRRRPKEIFLSHASRDRRFATRLASVLRRARLTTWYSKTSIVGAQQWHDEIGEALERCDWFIVVLSPAAVRSPWVKRELLRALNLPRYADRIVPLLHKDCKWQSLSWTLDAIQMVDFTESSFREGMERLLQIWRPARSATGTKAVTRSRRAPRRGT
jgi:hypothetical protein